MVHLCRRLRQFKRPWFLSDKEDPEKDPFLFDAKDNKRVRRKANLARKLNIRLERCLRLAMNAALP